MVAQGFRIEGVLFRECAQSPTFFLEHFVDGGELFRGEVDFESSLDMMRSVV